MMCRLSQVVSIARRVGRGCHLMVARSRVGLCALLFLLVVGVGVALKPPTVEAQTSADFTVQIAARLNPDGRVEFGLRLLDREGNPGERIHPDQRKFPRNVDDHRWLKATPLVVSQPSERANAPDDTAKVRIVARIHPTRNQIEFGLQYELPANRVEPGEDNYSKRLFARKRFWPDQVDHHRWLYTSEIEFTRHYLQDDEYMMDGDGSLDEDPVVVDVESVPYTEGECIEIVTSPEGLLVPVECAEVLAEWCESNPDNLFCSELRRSSPSIITTGGGNEQDQETTTAAGGGNQQDQETATTAGGGNQQDQETAEKLRKQFEQCQMIDFPHSEQEQKDCDPIFFQYCEENLANDWCIIYGYIEPPPTALEYSEGNFRMAVGFCYHRVVQMGRDMGTVCDALFEASCEQDRLQDFCSDLGYVELEPADLYPNATPVDQCLYWVRGLEKPIDPHCRDILQDSCDRDRIQEFCAELGLVELVPADHLPGATAQEQCFHWVQILEKPIDPHCRDILQDDCDNYRVQPLCIEQGLVELVPADYMPFGTELDQCWNWVLNEGEPIDPYCRTTLQQDCDQMVAQWWFYEGCVDLGLSDRPHSEPIQTLRIGPPGMMEADDGSMNEAGDGEMMESGDPVAPSETNDDDSSMDYECPEDPTFMCPAPSLETE